MKKMLLNGIIVILVLILIIPMVSAEQMVTPAWIYTTGMNIRSVSVSGDGGYVAAGSENTNGPQDDGKVSYFARDGTFLWSYGGDDSGISGIRAVAVSADGQYIAAGSINGKVYYFSKDGTLLWSYDTGYKVNSIAISADGENVAATGAYEWQGKIYYFSNVGTLLWSQFTDTNTGVTGISISPDGENIAVGSRMDSSDAGGKVYYYTRDGSLRWTYYTARIVYVDMSDDGNVAAGSENGFVYYFSKDGRVLWSYDIDFIIDTVAVSADGQYIITGAENGFVYYFSKEGELLWSFDTKYSLNSIAISADGQYVVAGTGYSINQVYYLSKNGDLLWNFTTAGQIFQVAVSADGRNVAVGSNLVYYFTNDFAPVAKFSGAPISGIVPLTVTFTDSSSGVISSYLWDFGDFVTSTDQSPLHEYKKVGVYTVTLTVTGPGGSDSVTQTDYITVNPQNDPPIATDESYLLKKGTMLTVLPNGILTNDYDPDGDTLIALKVTDPLHGIVILNNDGSFTYNPVKGYKGTDFFTYQANDGTLDSNVAIVTINVLPGNQK